MPKFELPKQPVDEEGERVYSLTNKILEIISDVEARENWEFKPSLMDIAVVLSERAYDLVEEDELLVFILNFLVNCYEDADRPDGHSVDQQIANFLAHPATQSVFLEELGDNTLRILNKVLESLKDNKLGEKYKYGK